MIRALHNIQQSYLWLFVFLPLVATCATATTRRGQAQEALAETPWSVYADGAKGGFYFNPACHQLSYFTGNPLRFDYGQDFFEWPADSFTYKTNVSTIGTAQQHPIYQIEQDVRHDPEKPPPYASKKVVMRRILVESRPDKYCLIFQETNSYGILYSIDPAVITKIDGARVLYIHDPLAGNGGLYMDDAWTFNRGVPIRLRFNHLVGPVVKQMLPKGCALPWRGDPLSLRDFTYRAALIPAGKWSGAQPRCGSVFLQLGIRNHNLVILSEQYTN